MAKFELDIPDDVIEDFNESQGRRLNDGLDAVTFIRNRIAAFVKTPVVSIRADRARAAAKFAEEQRQDAAVQVGVVVTVPPEDQPRGGGRP